MKQEVFIKKKELVEFFLKKGILLSEDILARLDDSINSEELKGITSKIGSQDILVLNNDITKIFAEISPSKEINWTDFEQSKAFSEKGMENAYVRFLDVISKSEPEKKEDYPVKVVFSYNSEIKKWSPEDFVEHLNVRLRSLEKMLRKRPELSNLISKIVVKITVK